MIKKDDVLKKCQEILYSYGTNYPVKPDDFNFLMQNIFPLHPQWNAKRGGRMVKQIIVHRHPDYKNLCFALILDGVATPVDISFTECIKRKGLKEDIKTACRTAVNDIYDPNRKSTLDKTVRDWIETFELGDLTVGRFLDYISASQVTFSDLGLIQNFRDYYQNYE